MPRKIAKKLHEADKKDEISKYYKILSPKRFDLSP